MPELVSMRKYDTLELVGAPPHMEPVPPGDKEKDCTVNVEKTSNGNGFHLSRPPLNLQWHNITFSTKDGKLLLKGLSGSTNSGELMAIMGPSGAGKSTLLNVLSGFTRAKVSGRITVNGAPRNTRNFLSCYIMQDDHLLPHLTVKETIYFTARLKIPSSVSKVDRDKAVEDCIDSLGLREQLNSRTNQLSGGQRKRLSIAQELVSDPCLIFLDEPTSGLDSTSCLQCIELLKSLAQEGRTVILTIHQPSSHIFELFDKLYLVAEGNCIYKGSTGNLIPFLSKQGLSCPTYYNPADFVMEVAAGVRGDWISKLKTEVSHMDGTKDVLPLGDEPSNFKKRSEIELHASTLTMLENQFESKHSSLEELENELESSFDGYATSSWNQFKVLIYRNFICMMREPMAVPVQVCGHVLVGLLFGVLYYDIGNNAGKIYSNSGFLFCTMLFLNYTSMMPTLLIFPLERITFAREHNNSCYSSGMYYLAKSFSEIPLQIVCPVMYCSIVYWMTGQPNDLLRFVIFTLSCLMVSLLAQSVSFVLGAATSVQNAVFLGPILSIPIALFSGFFISLDAIPSYLQWISYLSYARYCFNNVLLSIYGLDRPALECDKAVCPFQNPQDFLREMAMEDGNFYINFGAVLAFFVVLRTLSYFVLCYKVIYKR